MSRPADLARQWLGRRVTVIGDVMLDHFLFGRADRMSPEAPVPIIRFDREDYRLGGAANVANNVRALGGQATLVGLVGRDAPADELRRLLGANGLADAGLVVDPTRPTTRKVRVVTSRNQQVARVDYEEDSDVNDQVLRQLSETAARAVGEADAVVISDYRKGVAAPAVISAVARSARSAGVPLLVDPKLPHADRYRGATLITPNHHEAELMAGTRIRTPDQARDAARAIHEQSGANVLITWGEHGMWLLDASGPTTDERHLPASAREVADVTGAGDTVIATLALSLAAGAPLADAARVATIAAALVVARFGPAVAPFDELIAALDGASR